MLICSQTGFINYSAELTLRHGKAMPILPSARYSHALLFASEPHYSYTLVFFGMALPPVLESPALLDMKRILVRPSETREYRANTRDPFLLNLASKFKLSLYVRKLSFECHHFN